LDDGARFQEVLGNEPHVTTPEVRKRLDEAGRVLRCGIDEDVDVLGISGLGMKRERVAADVIALTPRAFKHANSSSKSFETIAMHRRPLRAELFDRVDALFGRHLRPEFAVRGALLLERRQLAHPNVHN
jgi:hypothetical protein